MRNRKWRVRRSWIIKDTLHPQQIYVLIKLSSHKNLPHPICNVTSDPFGPSRPRRGSDIRDGRLAVDLEGRTQRGDSSSAAAVALGFGRSPMAISAFNLIRSLDTYSAPFLHLLLLLCLSWWVLYCCHARLSTWQCCIAWPSLSSVD